MHVDAFTEWAKETEKQIIIKVTSTNYIKMHSK